jgi:glycyl-tRNA synthetase
MTDNLSIEDMAVFCKKKGFVYPNSEIYGGLSGFFDFGNLGVELNNNIKNEWWKTFVQSREDIVGIDGSIIAHPKVWQASGHVEGFIDLMLICLKCKERIRADQFIENELKIQVESLKPDDINKLIKKNNLKCPRCSSDFQEIKGFNLMFKINIGVTNNLVSYLRPETAQLIFTNFKLVVENARLKLPFGIAQIGKAFRNEISPRDFLFRCREFEQMEIEYFVHPDKYDDCPYIRRILNYKFNVYSEEMQNKKQKAKLMTIKECLNKKIIKTKWHAYWLAIIHKWFIDLGANKNKFRVRQHLQNEKSHYALDTWDLEYEFPFGYKELLGIANRTNFDLRQHSKFSNTDLTLYDEKSKKKIIPHVIAEPSIGVGRAFLVFMFDAYNYDKKRGNVVLNLHPKLTPYKAAVFSLVNKLNKDAKKVYDGIKKEFNCYFDVSGSIGRRYARADEIGVPFAITYDFDSKKDKRVTIRDRNTTKQIRVKIEDLKETIRKLINNEIKFEKAGTVVKYVK